jgi:phosphoglucosamine mutase
VASLFGTDGIRGRANEGALAPDRVLALGQALGDWLRARHGERPRVLIIRDTRRSGPLIQGALAAGLASRGVDVGLGEILPTPALAACVPAMGYQLGVVLSASHNAGPDNGIKLFGPDGRKLPDEDQDAIEARLTAPAPAGPAPTGEALGAIAPAPAARETYLRDLVAAAAVAGSACHGLRVALDCAYGATAATAPEVFRRLGADVVPVATALDGDRINDGVGALHPATLAAAVRAEGATVGFAFDGDGDRLICVDETGAVRDGDYVLLALARDLQANRRLPRHTVVGTVMTNLALEQALGHDGIALERAPVGDRHVADRCAAGGFAVGGEPSGHVLLWREGALRGDATLTALELVGVMLRRGATLAELCADYAPFPQVAMTVRVVERPPLDGVPAVAAALADARTALGDAARVVVRYSGTEPVARIMLEGRDRGALEAHAGRIAWAIRSQLGDQRAGGGGTRPDSGTPFA